MPSVRPRLEAAARASGAEAMVAHLKLLIAKLKRERSIYKILANRLGEAVHKGMAYSGKPGAVHRAAWDKVHACTASRL